MKKILALMLIITILSISGASYADTMLKKLGRGIANIATCPIEIIYRIGEANTEDGPFAAFTWGVINGVYRTALRAVVGVYEVATFPIPFPAHYEPVIDDPEFFLEDGLF